MAEAQADVRVSDDKQNVSVTFLPKSGATGTINLTLDQLTALIQGLGKVRRQMVAGKEMPALAGQPIEAVVNTRWHIHPEPMVDGSVLSFYRPSFGALGFLVPRDQVPLMIRLLAGHLQIQSTVSGKPN